METAAAANQDATEGQTASGGEAATQQWQWQQRQQQWQRPWQGGWYGWSSVGWGVDDWRGDRRSSVSSWGSEGSASGKWWSTPQGPVWGSSLDEAVHFALQRGWFSVDKQFCEWWSTQGNGSTGTTEDEGQPSIPVERDIDEAIDDQQPEYKEKKQPRTGKEDIPSFDGTTSMREYRRRVKLFESVTGIDKPYRGGRLLEKLSGQAWKAAETLEIEALRTENGVEVLLNHLQSELEPIEYLRTFEVLNHFFKTFKRQRGEEMTSYDTSFRVQCEKLKEVGTVLEGSAKAWWFLEKANIGDDLRQKVVTAANGDYEYNKLRQALVAIVPNSQKVDDSTASTSARPTHSARTWQRGGKGSSFKVNAVVEEHGESEGLQAGEEDDAISEAGLLEREAEVLVTQAAKKRAQVEKARGFQQVETPADRTKRIQDLKKRLPCSACKAKGRMVYGHWHSDPECPENKSNKSTSGTFVTSHASSDDDEEDDMEAAYMVEGTGLVMATSHQLRAQSRGLALSDTCCARTVAGERWVARHLEVLDGRQAEYKIVKEREPFRFGGGPKVFSKFAVIIPLMIHGADTVPYLRVSVVAEDVPLLVSQPALRSLGMVMDLVGGVFSFAALNAPMVELITTDTGHVGFDIVKATSAGSAQPDWGEILHIDSEVWISSRTGSDSRVFAAQVDNAGTLTSQVDSLRPQDWGESLRSKRVTWRSPLTDPCEVLSDFDTSWLETDHNLPDRSHGPDHPLDLRDHVLRDKGGSSPCESRLRGPHCGTVAARACRPGQDDSGSAQGVVASDETPQDISCVGGRVEEKGQGRATSDLRGTGDPMVWPPERRPLDEVLSSEVYRGDRELGPRKARGAKDHRGVPGEHHAAGAVLRELPRAHVGKAEPAHSRSVLGMSRLPRVPGDASKECGWQACGNRPGRDGQEQGQGQEQEQGRGGGRINQAWKSAIRGLSDFVLGTGGWRQRLGGTRKGQRAEHEHELVEGGTRADHEPQVQVESSVKEPVGALVRDPEELRQVIRRRQDREKVMRQGTRKRLVGNIRHIFGVFAVTLASLNAQVASGALSVAKFGTDRPDVVEVCAGCEIMSKHFSRWGWWSLSPVEVNLGGSCDDMSMIVDRVDCSRPRLVVVSCPPEVMQSNKQGLRARAEWSQIASELFVRQTQRGDEALIMAPCGDVSVQLALERTNCANDIQTCVAKGCTTSNGKPKRANMLWLSSSYELCDAIARESRLSRHASDISDTAVAKVCAQTVIKGFVKMLKNKCPGRIYRLLTAVQRRLKAKRAGNTTELRWSERAVNRAMKQWDHVHTTLVSASSPRQDQDQSSSAGHALNIDEQRGKRVERSREPTDGDVLPSGEAIRGPRVVGSEGVFFEIPTGRTLKPEYQAALKKIHMNLGHPSPYEIKRVLRHANAHAELVEASQWLRCTTCSHSKGPRTHRTCTVHPHENQFCDEVKIDLFQIHDVREKGFWCLSVVDRATMFHLAVLVKDHAPETLWNAFFQCWVQWAGPPKRIVVDQERGLIAEAFAKPASEAGCHVDSIASQAHWQAGKVERHNQLLKSTLRNTVKCVGVEGESMMRVALAESCAVKNNMIREFGFSPSTLVFGKDVKQLGEIHCNGMPSSFHLGAGDGDTEIAQRIRCRYHARIEFIKAQSKDMLDKTLQNRTRKALLVDVGDTVFFWREAKTKKSARKFSCWNGPACVVGKQKKQLLAVVWRPLLLGCT